MLVLKVYSRGTVNGRRGKKLQFDVRIGTVLVAVISRDRYGYVGVWQPGYHNVQAGSFDNAIRIIHWRLEQPDPWPSPAALTKADTMRNPVQFAFLSELDP